MSRFKKKAGHYRIKERKGKDERQVMSFEQLPLDEYEEQNDAAPIDKKRVLIALLVLAAMVLSVLLYFSGGMLPSCTGCVRNSGGKEKFSANIIGASVEAGNFRMLSEGACYASDTDFVSLSADGVQRFSEQHGLANPILKTKGDKSLAYDLGSNSYSIYSLTRKEHTAEAEKKISLADITADGVYALVTEAMGYNAKLHVYNADHSNKYAFSFADYYITSMALNPSGTGAVVCGASADKGVRTSVIYVLDFRKEEPVAKHIISEDTVFDCDYLSSDSVCAVGSKGTYVCTGNSFARIEKISYNQMTITAYDINSDVGVAVVSVSRSGDGRNCNLEYINSSGKVTKTIETELGVSSVSTYKDRIAVSDGSDVSLYKSNGTIVASYSTENTCKQIRLYGVSGVYVLGLDRIIGISL